MSMLTFLIGIIPTNLLDLLIWIGAIFFIVWIVKKTILPLFSGIKTSTQKEKGRENRKE